MSKIKFALGITILCFISVFSITSLEASDTNLCNAEGDEVCMVPDLVPEGGWVIADYIVSETKVNYDDVDPRYIATTKDEFIDELSVVKAISITDDLDRESLNANPTYSTEAGLYTEQITDYSIFEYLPNVLYISFAGQQMGDTIPEEILELKKVISMNIEDAGLTSLEGLDDLYQNSTNTGMYDSVFVTLVGNNIVDIADAYSITDVLVADKYSEGNLYISGQNITIYDEYKSDYKSIFTEINCPEGNCSTSPLFTTTGEEFKYTYSEMGDIQYNYSMYENFKSVFSTLNNSGIDTDNLDKTQTFTIEELEDNDYSYSVMNGVVDNNISGINDTTGFGYVSQFNIIPVELDAKDGWDYISDAASSDKQLIDKLEVVATNLATKSEFDGDIAITNYDGYDIDNPAVGSYDIDFTFTGNDDNPLSKDVDAITITVNYEVKHISPIIDLTDISMYFDERPTDNDELLNVINAHLMDENGNEYNGEEISTMSHEISMSATNLEIGSNDLTVKYMYNDNNDYVMDNVNINLYVDPIVSLDDFTINISDAPTNKKDLLEVIQASIINEYSKEYDYSQIESLAHSIDLDGYDFSEVELGSYNISVTYYNSMTADTLNTSTLTVVEDSEVDPVDPDTEETESEDTTNEIETSASVDGDSDGNGILDTGFDYKVIPVIFAIVSAFVLYNIKKRIK